MQRSRPSVPADGIPEIDHVYNERERIPGLEWQQYWNKAMECARSQGFRGSASSAWFTQVSKQKQVVIEMKAYYEYSAPPGTLIRFLVKFPKGRLDDGEYVELDRQIGTP